MCGVVLVYVFFGGMRGTAWANAFQTSVFMVLGVVTFVVIANKLGGEDSFYANLCKLGEAIPEAKATRAEMSKTKFFTYLLIPLSVGMFPHLFQHWLTAKSASSFKLPVVAHPVFIMIVWVPCVLVGVWATTELIPVKPPLPKIPGTEIVNANAILPVPREDPNGRGAGRVPDGGHPGGHHVEPRQPVPLPGHDVQHRHREPLPQGAAERPGPGAGDARLHHRDRAGDVSA